MVKIVDIWRYENMATMHLSGVPYALVLPELERHRSFSLSVQSSRASELPLDVLPHWSEACGSRMFDSRSARKRVQATATFWWTLHRVFSRFVARRLQRSGLHRQHWQAPLLTHASVSLFITGDEVAWIRFFYLRLSPYAKPDMRIVAEKTHDTFFGTQREPVEPRRVYGPYLPREGLPLTEASPDNPAIARAIVRVGRVTTGNTDTGITDEKAVAWVRRAIDKRHASVFEHHWLPTPGRHGPLNGAVSLRYLWGVD